MTVHIRVIGDPAEVEKAVERQYDLFEVVGRSSPKPSRKKPGTVLVYLEADLANRGGE